MTSTLPRTAHGLKHYAGGRENHPSCPTLTCATNIRLWLRDLELEFGSHWTEVEKIDLAKQYAVGSAYGLICNTVRREEYVWSEVKQNLLCIFNENQTYYEMKTELVTSRRRTGESIPEFWSRLECIVFLIILKSNPVLKTI